LAQRVKFVDAGERALPLRQKRRCIPIPDSSQGKRRRAADQTAINTIVTAHQKIADPKMTIDPSIAADCRHDQEDVEQLQKPERRSVRPGGGAPCERAIAEAQTRRRGPRADRRRTLLRELAPRPDSNQRPTG
jgi:hypothetical protein